MAEIIDMPKLSDTMTVGTIVNWLKKEGEAVSVGDMLCEIETDKATMELENLVADGVILKIYINESGEAPVGAPICAIGEKGEAAPDVAAPQSAPAEPEAAPAEAAPVVEEATKPEPEGRKQESKPAPTAPAPASSDSGKRIKVSPLARKLAEEKGIPLEAIQPSGPSGRIVKKDVLAAAEKGVTAPAAASSAPIVIPSGAGIAEEGPVKISNMRKAIAKHLVESKTQIPHFYLETEVDAAALIKTRAQLNKDLTELPPEKGGIKLTVNDFILKASAEALRRVPGVNASWMGDHIQQHSSVHLAFGVAVPDGLVTPVVRDAQAKTLRQVSAEAKGLIGKARDKKLKPDEMSGSTFTVTNLGMFGVTGFYGIISPPNAAILSVGATIAKPVVNANGEITIGHRMAIGLSGDHRVIDGATGAMFLQALQTLLETPALMLV
ncbi:dihydrolipoamide acetyltransferase family protein [Rubellicoccus peritrichatus]|uniref:Dihydrolipoamide acetyltransferase component of pyruvate dehydrogenase complex n=1 Tax=Rubellicoccus peritrichatus TaxID=3080537 RepID=A0AAQ3LEG5_9BACT|nr:dihydrolipoamide acetyltransferase family protein [Puniceicoccus sp. CR14]WOO42415.1 dihydrolipoamide acetyltransferase family protein [Puniceicoccus sp. CR14]